MIRVVICDDNIVFMNHFKDIVESSLSTYNDDFQISTVSNGNLLLAKHMESEFDIIFLDIDMPDISGFDVAKVLRDNNSRCFLIFITNHSELVYESMDFQPFNFIRKCATIFFPKIVLFSHSPVFSMVLISVLRHG